MPSRRKGDNEKNQKAMAALEEMCASGDPQSAYEGTRCYSTRTMNANANPNHIRNSPS